MEALNDHRLLYLPTWCALTLEHQLADLGVEVKKDIRLFESGAVSPGAHCRAEKQERTASGARARPRLRGLQAADGVAASLLLKPAYLPLQETNDRYFANIQKDSGYSVVPRVPGGEITPQGLIALGEVAARYDLYTKITGHQRIDLFGARLAQLSAI